MSMMTVRWWMLVTVMLDACSLDKTVLMGDARRPSQVTANSPTQTVTLERASVIAGADQTLEPSTPKITLASGITSPTDIP